MSYEGGSQFKNSQPIGLGPGVVSPRAPVRGVDASMSLCLLMVGGQERDASMETNCTILQWH